MTYEQAYVTMKHAMRKRVPCLVKFQDEDAGYEVSFEDHDGDWSWFTAYSAGLDCLDAIASGR